jgi:hypothetical protein
MRKPGQKKRLIDAERYSFLATPEDVANMHTLIASVDRVETYADAMRFALKVTAKLEKNRYKAACSE